MPTSKTSDRQALLVWTMLAIVGAILCLIGWQRFLFSTTLLAQAQTPAFEVASIKENKSEASVRGGGPQPGRFLRTNVTLRQLIQMAYSRRALDQREMLGGPSWIDSARFDVEGKFGDAAPSYARSLSLRSKSRGEAEKSAPRSEKRTED